MTQTQANSSLVLMTGNDACKFNQGTAMQRNSSRGDDIIWDRASLKAAATQLGITIKVKLLLQNYY